MPDFDWLSTETVCPRCGAPMKWEDCWNGCDDGYLPLYGEDLLWYNEEEGEECDICEGEGGWWICPVVHQHKYVLADVEIDTK